jgi:hypothetical protein
MLLPIRRIELLLHQAAYYCVFCVEQVAEPRIQLGANTTSAVVANLSARTSALLHSHQTITYSVKL